MDPANLVTISFVLLMCGNIITVDKTKRSVHGGRRQHISKFRNSFHAGNEKSR